MDNIYYDKIADKLLQFRGKLPKDDHLQCKDAQKQVRELRKYIDGLIYNIDMFAHHDAKGWIK